MFISTFGKFPAIFLWTFFCSFGCYNLSGVLVLWARCPTFLASSAYFSLFFSLSLSVCTNSLNVSSSLLILPSVGSNLPLGLSCEFLNFRYYTFNCRISIWFSFRISLSLLTFSLWQCQMMWLVIMPSFTSFIILSFNFLNVVIMSTLKSLPFKSFFGSLSQIVYVVCLFSGIRFILSCFFGYIIVCCFCFCFENWTLQIICCTALDSSPLPTPGLLLIYV